MITKALFLAIIFLVTVFSVQNAAPVAISFLFWKFEASLAILIYLLVLLGAGLGMIIMSWSRFRTSLKKPPLKKKEDSDAGK